MEPDQIDMMNEDELRNELRKLIARPSSCTVDSLVRCDGCRWWNAQGPDAGDGWETESGPTPFGECKRFPPTTVNDGEGTEPIARHDYTLADDWCGEFTPNARNHDSSEAR